MPRAVSPRFSHALIACLVLCVSSSFFIPHSSFAATAPQVAVFSRTDSLFVTAATGEPRFQAARDSAETLLRAGGAATLDWLVDTASRPGRSLTPRQSHYIERLFTVMSDSGRDEAPRRALARAAAGATSDTARARWLYIGSRIGDTAFRHAARAWLRDSSAAVRRMAARGLGAYPHAEHPALLWDGLQATRGLERHMRLWALAEHAPFRDAARAAPPLASGGNPSPSRAGIDAALRRLAPLLADTNLYNRQKVRDMMLGAADSSWAALARSMPRRPGAVARREWWLLARDAKGGASFLDAQRKAMSAEDRIFFGMKR